jgi:GMP synthase (glutamine-hydrolysing)
MTTVTNHSPRILVLHFSTSVTRVDVLDRLQVLRERGIVLTTINVATEYATLPPPIELLRDHDGVILMGASSLYYDGKLCASDPARTHTEDVHAALVPLVLHVLTHDIPTFGFCFGHQLIARVVGSSVIACDETAKTGTYEVLLTDEALGDPLCAGLPRQFNANYGHKDVVAVVPDGAVRLAYGSQCHLAMVRYGNNVYTTQFHPELNRAHMRSILAEYTDYVRDAADIEAIQDTPHAARLLENFAHRVSEMSQARV